MTPAVSLGLSIVAILMLLVSGWLGGKMVFEAGVAVNGELQPEAMPADNWRGDRLGSSRGSMAGGMPRSGDRAMARDEPSRETDRS